tara:strand:- start:141 stop:338 length:198 start_codon:yes stop_codon:yes gene_type:complete
MSIAEKPTLSIRGILMAHQNPTMMASVTSLSPEPEIKDPPDLAPSEYEPKDEQEYESLEEALTSD